MRGFWSAAWGRQFRDRSVAEHRQGPQHRRQRPVAAVTDRAARTLRTDEETTAAAEDAVAAALGIAPGENVFRRGRTYGVSGRTLAVADETAAGGGSHLAGHRAVAIDVVTDRSHWAAFFRKNEPLLRIHQTLFDEHHRPQRLNVVIRSTQAATSGPLRFQD